ncbi:4'-phosphopantetheinyl transferase family protein [Streptomyces sp. NPDC048187]|uniref:4'-phosphopantetheinyl transferase family protein n=1 Tax=Streptomyces sp. NPDC048187 TaxID=3365509 RepID=UPI00371363DD
MTDLWTLPEDRVPELARQLGGVALLSAHERARHGRLRTSGARLRFLGGRLLCRTALTVRTGLPVDTWRFVRTRQGRPELAGDHGGLRFNLSHTHGLIACVVTRGRACGVDVERTPFDRATAGPLRDRFDDVQRAALDSAPDPTVALGELWVLTEAYLKGLGTGLACGVRETRFEPCGSGRFIVTDPRRPDAGRRWRLDLLRPDPGHLLAVAVDGGTAPPHHHDLGADPAPPRPSTL